MLFFNPKTLCYVMCMHIIHHHDASWYVYNRGFYFGCVYGIDIRVGLIYGTAQIWFGVGLSCVYMLSPLL